MSKITASDVSKLRAKTGVSMMACKKALVATNGDIEAAVKKLRELGIAVASKRAEKEVNQGIIAAKTSKDGNRIAMVEVNSETDFVARNADFVKFVDFVAEHALTNEGDVAEELKDELTKQISTIGENIKIRRSAKFTRKGTGRLGSYIHMGGKVGVIIDVGCEKSKTVDQEAFIELVRDLTLQVAASSPRWLERSDVPVDVIEAEREIYNNQMKEEKKPANIIGKIVDGKLNKFFGEICLLEQIFVKENALTITKLLDQVGKEVGDTLTIRRYKRFQLGA